MNISIRSIVNAQFKFSLYCKKILKYSTWVYASEYSFKAKKPETSFIVPSFYHIANHWQS